MSQNDTPTPSHLAKKNDKVSSNSNDMGKSHMQKEGYWSKLTFTKGVAIFIITKPKKIAYKWIEAA